MEKESSKAVGGSSGRNPRRNSGDPVRKSKRWSREGSVLHVYDEEPDLRKRDGVEDRTPTEETMSERVLGRGLELAGTESLVNV